MFMLVSAQGPVLQEGIAASTEGHALFVRLADTVRLQEPPAASFAALEREAPKDPMHVPPAEAVTAAVTETVPFAKEESTPTC